MSFLAPGFLLAALAAALGVVAVHLIGWRRPDDFILPTTRFVPDESVRRSARATRPTDILLLAIRAAMVVLAAVALARPSVAPRRSGAVQLVLLDRSRAVADPAEARDSVLALRREGVAQVVLGFDSAAFPMPGGELEASAGLRGEARASLSAALVAAVREAARLSETYESVEIALVSPLVREELDAAASGIRDMWRDEIRIARVGGVSPHEAPVELDMQAPDDDAVAAGLRLARAHGFLRGAGTVRVFRGTTAGQDSAWARAGGVLVHWPLAAAFGSTPDDSTLVRGIHTTDATMLGYLARLPLPGDGRVVARWLDGSAAAVESRHGAGCVRTVGFDVPGAGDLTLTPAFQRLAATLVAPCGGPVDSRPIADSLVRRISVAPEGGVRTGIAAPRLTAGSARIARWLLALVLVLAMVEMLVRRSTRRPVATAVT